MFGCGSKLRAAQIELQSYILSYNLHLTKYNLLIDRINKKGGEEFLDIGVMPVDSQFNEDEISSLISLCHPDKHQNKQVANDMVAKLLSVKSEFKKR